MRLLVRGLDTSYQVTKLRMFSQIDHFTVVFLVTWPLSGSEAAVDLAMIQTLELLTYERQKGCIKEGAPPASPPLKGKVTKHTTVK